MKKYIFIGNENDPLTRAWGIKNGEAYELSFLAFSPKPQVIITVGNEHHTCPYSTVKSFKANWKEIR
jgi:hypothetical protein